MNGCPLSGFELYRDDGASGAITTLVSTYEPQELEATITLTAADESKTFRVQVKAFNHAGSITSGIGSFVIANVPDQPAIPTYDVSLSNDSQIKILYGTVLPDNRGSDITSLHLMMDDGLGGEFVTVTGLDQINTATSRLITGLVKGLQYGFKYRVSNKNGWSAESDILYVTTADVPAKPPTPTLVGASST